MALKKVTKSNPTASTSGSLDDSRSRRLVEEQRRKARTLAKQQQAAERISAATIELASGLTESATARDQLSTAISEVATGAEEAAGACQESLAAVTQIANNLKRQKELAHGFGNKAEHLHEQLKVASEDILQLVDSVKKGADRQNKSVSMMTDLEQQAANINEAVKQVMHIADQTNLLALNAAIEAGRAGQHGKGFAVVADTVRSLAEVSEKSANKISELAESIQEQGAHAGKTIKQSAENAVQEAQKGEQVTQQITEIQSGMDAIFKGAQELQDAAEEMDIAADDIQKGSESIAAAAEQQSAAAEEVVNTLEQQAVALSGAEQAAQDLENIADDLKNSTDISKSAEEVAVAAEELSATVEEINRSASEISTAIDQISRGAEQAASAVEQSVAGITQLGKGVELSEEEVSALLEISENINNLLQDNKMHVESMVAGINNALETGISNLQAIEKMEQLVRSIDKIIDIIATVAIKTSMLAVNGAVEAARAGEYGKGFAVVSSDIQNLADEASENVEQIKDLVSVIQDLAIRVRVDLSDVAENARLEVAKASQVTSKLLEIEGAVQAIVSSNQEILQASTEISTAVEQAQKGMEQISAAAEQASSNSQEASVAARQQAQGTEQLAEAIEEIASIADELQSA